MEEHRVPGVERVAPAKPAQEAPTVVQEGFGEFTRDLPTAPPVVPAVGGSSLTRYLHPSPWALGPDRGLSEPISKTGRVSLFGKTSRESELSILGFSAVSATSKESERTERVTSRVSEGAGVRAEAGKLNTSAKVADGSQDT